MIMATEEEIRRAPNEEKIRLDREAREAEERKQRVKDDLDRKIREQEGN